MCKLSKIYTTLLIIGTGPAGYTAAIYAARANINTIIITGPQPGGQLLNTNSIENWPGDYKNLNGSNLMNRMLKHVKKFPINILHDIIKHVDFKKNPFFIKGEKNIYISDSVIIATGASPRYLNIPTEKLYIGRGVSTCAVCDGFFYKNKSVAIIGGGNTALEEALYLSNIAKLVYIIHRRKKFTADKILIQRLKEKIKINKIVTYMSYTVDEILGDNSGVTGIKINSVINKKIFNVIKVFGIFIAIGYIPNSKIFLKYIDTCNNFIKTNIKNNYHNFHTQTNIPGIFAAGDVTDHIYRQAITAASSGCMAAMDAERYINNFKK